MKQGRIFWSLFAAIIATIGVTVTVDHLVSNFIAGLASGVLVSLVLAFFLSRRIVDGLQHVEEIVEQVNNNDLTVKVPEVKSMMMDTVLHRLDEMVFGLKSNFKDQINVSTQITEISDRLKDIVDQFNSAMEGISSSTDATSQSSDMQFAMLQDSRAEMERIVAELSKMESDMQETYTYSTDTIQATRGSIESTSSILDIMKQVRELIISISERVEVLYNRSDEVVELNGLVNSIAEQTNLLALNASIEAARAGEHGRGFAIVATEISKLSSETNQASTKIKDTIDTLKDGLEEIKVSVDSDREYIEKGYTTVEHTIEEFTEIQHSLEKSKDYIEGMNTAIQKVTLDGRKVSEQIVEVTRFSEEITSRMQEAASQVMVQSSETENLAELTDSLNTNADDLLQFVANKVMRGKMLRDVKEIEKALRGQSLSNEKLDSMRKSFNVDVIYITNLDGEVEFCNERETIGLNLYKIDPSYGPLHKRQVEYVTTPVKHRVEDGKLFKFLAILGEDNRCYQVGLAVETIKNF